MVIDRIIPPVSASVEYLGRWEKTGQYAAASACGSSFRLGFRGETVLLAFDVSRCEQPFPHQTLKEKDKKWRLPIKEAAIQFFEHFYRRISEEFLLIESGEWVFFIHFWPVSDPTVL